MTKNVQPGTPSQNISYHKYAPNGINSGRKAAQMQRINVETGLAHDYLANYYDPADQPAAEKPFTFEMEFDKYPTNKLKEMLFNEAITFKMAKLT